MGSICLGYMCILLYMKLIWCNGFPKTYAQLEEGVRSICHDYMCIVLYIYVTHMKIQGFHVVLGIYTI